MQCPVDRLGHGGRVAPLDDDLLPLTDEEDEILTLDEAPITKAFDVTLGTADVHRAPAAFLEIVRRVR